MIYNMLDGISIIKVLLSKFFYIRRFQFLIGVRKQLYILVRIDTICLDLILTALIINNIEKNKSIPDLGIHLSFVDFYDNRFCLFCCCINLVADFAYFYFGIYENNTTFHNTNYMFPVSQTKENNTIFIWMCK